MENNITDDERKLIGFALACYLEDFEKRLEKSNQNPKENTVFVSIEKLTYTKIIPESFSGPKPDYWK